MLLKNQTLTLTVEGQNDQGFGVAHVGGMAVFVKGGVKGDVVQATVLKVAKTWAAAKADRILTPSPHRCPSGCDAAGCGGCAYRELVYEEEERIKAEDVRMYFRKAGLSATVLPTVTAGPINGYRNKAQYAFGRTRDGRLTAGFFAPRSHRLVPAVHCPLAPALFGEAVERSLAILSELGLAPYEEETGKGLLRHLYLRHSEKEGKVLYTLVINGRSLPDESAFVEKLRRALPFVSGILLNFNTEKTNVILGKEYRTLWGEDFITDTLGGVTLKIAPDAFFQVNRPAADALYAKAKELACLSGRELLWDLYSGAGRIGLSMADSCREIVGVEIVPAAVENAGENAKRNGIRHARFVTGAASSPETLLAGAYGEGRAAPDVVVLDPPRKGCSPELLSYLADTVKVLRIVYISCAPDTLARDCALLVSKGYSLSPVTPVNLFPRTGHVESVVCLTRQSDVI